MRYQTSRARSQSLSSDSRSYPTRSTAPSYDHRHLNPTMLSDTASNDWVSFVAVEFTIGLHRDLKRLIKSPEDIVSTAQRVVRNAGMPAFGTLYVINDMHRSPYQKKKTNMHFTAVVFDHQGIFYGITHLWPNSDDCEIRQYNPERSAKRQPVITKWLHVTLTQLKRDGLYVEIAYVPPKCSYVKFAGSVRTRHLENNLLAIWSEQENYLPVEAP
ncbi:hypothetical protein BDN70DRAFT_899663 [Pholiota conissans]|uniref:Uncharacterized protein n=1 Tax=Pholiota conissans TaxID=109636 RepID=A0A9P5YTM3_9AGAR|nr:hypothetical protein BDN70DRAFT_899663 [Pholiota conissans]